MHYYGIYMTSHPQNALIGMDMQMYESRRIVGDYNAADSGYGDVVLFDYDYIEVNIWCLVSVQSFLIPFLFFFQFIYFLELMQTTFLLTL